MNLFFKKIVPCGLLFILISTILLMCAVPPVSRDALTHHLAVPKLYVLYGGIYELPNILPSYYPELLDLIYCIPMIFDNDIFPKYIHFCFALFTALLIYKYVQRKINHSHALLSILFFLSLPVIVKLSITVYVDLGLIFFSFAALLSLLKWREDNFNKKWFIISAICCGLALSTKYNGLITLFLLTFLTPIVYLNQNKSKKYSQFQAGIYGFLFLLIALLIFSPWMIKNYKWTKNPVYPLYKSFFNPSHPSDTKRIAKKNNINSSNKKTAINHFHVRKYVYKESGWQTLSIPVRIFFQGEDDNPKYFDGRLNPLLFFLPILAFLNIKLNTNKFEIKILLSFSVLYILIVFFQVDMRTRWVSPAIPPLILLSSYGLKNLLGLVKPDKRKKYFNYTTLSSIITLLIASIFFINFVYLYKLFKKTDPLPYIFNQVTESQYIQKFRPEYATFQFANSNLGKNSKILAFFLGGRRYHSNHNINFSKALFQRIVEQAGNENDILDKLKRHRYTDLIINYPKFNNWIELEFNDNNKKQLIYLFFTNHTDKLFSKDGHGLYHLK